MPQGGIDEGETPEVAALREMEEEIGTAKAEIVSAYENWIYYRLPPGFVEDRLERPLSRVRNVVRASVSPERIRDINIETEHEFEHGMG